MKSFIILGLAVLTLVLTSCEDGPSGPHPSQELVTIYDNPPIKGIKKEFSGRMVVNGQVVTMTSVPMEHDTAFPNEIHLSAWRLAGGNTPTLRLKFKTLPLSPGTFAFTASTVVPGTSSYYVPTSDQGAFVLIGGNYYAPISGTITITKVHKDDTFIYSYSGYVSGRLQAMWPRGFQSTPSQPFPPGFTSASPVLVGETLTLQSAVFKTRSRIAIPLNGQG